MKRYISNYISDSFNNLWTAYAYQLRTPESFALFEEVSAQDILINEIFSRLTCKELVTFGLVNKNLNSLTNAPTLLKQKIYQEKTFNPEDWQHFFCFAGEDAVEARGKLPDSIVELFKKSRNECKHFVWIPKGMSINFFGDLLTKYYPSNPKGYSSIYENIRENIGEISTLSAEWVMILPDGCIMNEELRRKINGVKIINIPRAIEAVVAAFKDSFKFKNRNSVFTLRCQEIINLIGMRKVIVQSSKNGPIVSLSHRIFECQVYKHGVGSIGFLNSL